MFIELWIKNKLASVNANVFPLKVPANVGDLPVISYVATAKDREDLLDSSKGSEWVVTATFEFDIFSLDIEEALTLADEVRVALDKEYDEANKVDSVHIVGESQNYFEVPEAGIKSVYHIIQTYTVQYQESTS